MKGIISTLLISALILINISRAEAQSREFIANPNLVMRTGRYATKKAKATKAIPFNFRKLNPESIGSRGAYS